MEVKLIVVGGKSAGRELPVAGPKFLIGRSQGCHLRPRSDQVSRRHCALLLEEGKVTVRDLGSRSGTLVNGRPITEPMELKNGDQLKIGPLEFDVQITVPVGRKKKPKVNSVQEAAARSAETSAVDELDITQWLEEGADQDTRVVKLESLTKGTSGSSSPNLAGFEDPTGESSKKEEEESKKKDPKVVQEPSTESSRDAASELLDHMFHPDSPSSSP
ncbi:MAG: FHA domain-containing protein [Planctomycetes bacterium]|nr:FHA domain-containing protein [Planctomycetota bacterium]